MTQSQFAQGFFIFWASHFGAWTVEVFNKSDNPNYKSSGVGLPSWVLNRVGKLTNPKIRG